MRLPSPVLSQSRSLRYVTFFYLYVMQGLPAGFTLTALTNYLAAEGVNPVVIGGFAATVGLPWSFQFVWGPLIDRFQGSAMGRRRPWVLGTQLLSFLASFGVLFVRDPVAQVGVLGAAFFIHSVFASVQDASVDAMAISVIPDSERGRVNAFMRGGFLTGIGAGAAVFAFLLRTYGFGTAALVQSALLLGLTLVTFFIRERPGDALLPQFFGKKQIRQAGLSWPQHSFRWLFGELSQGLFSRRSGWLFGPILLVYLANSLFIRAFNVHLIQQLGWRDTELSVFSGIYGMLVALSVALIGGILADRVGTHRLMIGILGIVGSFLVVFNGLSEFWPGSRIPQVGLVIWYTVDPAFSIAAMPALMAICRPGVEGSQFTTYMALVNFADVVGAYLSGWALSFVSAPTIGLLSGGLILSALGMLWMSRQRSSVTRSEFG